MTIHFWAGLTFCFDTRNPPNTLRPMPLRRCVLISFSILSTRPRNLSRCSRPRLLLPFRTLVPLPSFPPRIAVSLRRQHDRLPLPLLLPSGQTVPPPGRRCVGSRRRSDTDLHVPVPVTALRRSRAPGGDRFALSRGGMCGGGRALTAGGRARGMVGGRRRGGDSGRYGVKFCGVVRDWWLQKMR